MTEDEARTRWCPFARIADGEPPVAVNRPEPYGDVPKCLGSFCMAWRWDDIPNPEYDRQRHVFQGGLYPIPLAPPMTVKSDTDGHCGLPGRP